ncbi:hypothetical protein [Nocardioides ferulae]|uniref:hypothetical protein n=1 Tax=Nocardioides ferulae TaxID=2340821 RepID=UPI000F86B4B1|nr:hypothetical protein [Nocardioides ferulae]
MGGLLGRGVVSLAIVLALTGCQESSGDEPGPEPTAEAAGPCLVTAEQLTEITGVAQELLEPDVSEVRTHCQTMLDERDVSIEWGLHQPALDPPPTQAELRSYLVEDDSTVAEIDLGAGVRGWAARGTPVGLPIGQVVAVLDDRVLQVEVTGTAMGGEDVPVDEVGHDAEEIAKTVVAAYGR